MLVFYVILMGLEVLNIEEIVGVSGSLKTGVRFKP